jgi:cytosine/adenosine deaminase-related metal-dependent hydrolase
MKNKLIIPKQIVCADSKNRILRNTAVEVSGNEISSIRSFSEKEIKDFDGEILNAGNLTLIPGFIQTHIHLCQTLFRGLADEMELLDWLQEKIFPYENAHNKNSLRVSVQLGINELLRGGTTTIMDMGTLRHQEVIFEELINSEIRAFAGKCMIDQNDLFPEFKASTNDELNASYELAKSFHNQGEERIKYAFAPRFVLAASERLLVETKAMLKDFDGSIFHSHASENIKELAEVRKKYKQENIEYFNSLNILDDHTVLAHCIHLNENEVDILKQKKVNVAHCPSSNLKLGSGIADIPRYLKNGIPVSLSSDGAACNNNLSAFLEMRLAALIQKPVYGAGIMDAKTVFRLATIDGAKALHIEDKTGSIEQGKKADLVLLDLDNVYKSFSNDEQDVYSNIVYSSSKEDVIHVMADGKWLVKDGVSVMYDEFELFQKGREELGQLIKRAK